MASLDTSAVAAARAACLKAGVSPKDIAQAKAAFENAARRRTCGRMFASVTGFSLLKVLLRTLQRPNANYRHQSNSIRQSRLAHAVKHMLGVGWILVRHLLGCQTEIGLQLQHFGGLLTSLV